MLVPVLQVNPEIIKYKNVSASFCTMIQDEPNHATIELNFDHGEDDKYVCEALNAVDTETGIKRLLKA